MKATLTLLFSDEFQVRVNQTNNWLSDFTSNAVELHIASKPAALPVDGHVSVDSTEPFVTVRHFCVLLRGEVNAPAFPVTPLVDVSYFPVQDKLYTLVDGKETEHQSIETFHAALVHAISKSTITMALLKTPQGRLVDVKERVSSGFRTTLNLKENIMPKACTYHVLPSVDEVLSDGTVTNNVIRPAPGQTPSFWSVYHRNEQGRDGWIADVVNELTANLIAGTLETARAFLDDITNLPTADKK